MISKYAICMQCFIYNNEFLLVWILDKLFENKLLILRDILKRFFIFYRLKQFVINLKNLETQFHYYRYFPHRRRGFCKSNRVSFFLRRVLLRWIYTHYYRSGDFLNLIDNWLYALQIFNLFGIMLDLGTYNTFNYNYKFKILY